MIVFFFHVGILFLAFHYVQFNFVYISIVFKIFLKKNCKFIPFGIETGVLGMLAGVLACTVESISYYPTVSQMCNAPPPPLHAINRGIGTIRTLQN